MNQKKWLDEELGRQLRPVSAPDDLWRRIHEQRRPLRVRPGRRIQWSVAAAALVASFAILAGSRGAPAVARAQTNEPRLTHQASQPGCFLCHAARPALAVVR